jgi:hypothetical protein
VREESHAVQPIELAAAAATEASQRRGRHGTCDMCAAGVVAATVRHQNQIHSPLQEGEMLHCRLTLYAALHILQFLPLDCLNKINKRNDKSTLPPPYVLKISKIYCISICILNSVGMNMYDVSYCIGSAQLKIVLTRRKIRIIYTRFGSGVGLDTYLAVDGGLVW